MESKRRHISIKNSIDELPSLAVQIETLADEWELSMPLGMNINLVLEEALTNVIFYAFDDKEEHQISVDIKKSDKLLSIQICDDGKAFDPTKQKTPDTSLSIEDRQIGGLGIFLIKKLMDKISYQRVNNKNIFTISKNL